MMMNFTRNAQTSEREGHQKLGKKMRKKSTRSEEECCSQVRRWIQFERADYPTHHQDEAYSTATITSTPRILRADGLLECLEMTSVNEVESNSELTPRTKHTTKRFNWILRALTFVSVGRSPAAEMARYVHSLLVNQRQQKVISIK